MNYVSHYTLLAVVLPQIQMALWADYLHVGGLAENYLKTGDYQVQ